MQIAFLRRQSLEGRFTLQQRAKFAGRESDSHIERSELAVDSASLVEAHLIDELFSDSVTPDS